MDVILACHQPLFLNALALELANVSKSAVARMAAGLQLKNYLTAKDPEVRLQYQQRWLAMDAPIKLQVKTLVSRCVVEYGVCVIKVCPLPPLAGGPSFGNRDLQANGSSPGKLLESPDVYCDRPCPLFSQCVAYIASAELPMGEWPDILRILVVNVTSPQSTEALKTASLDALGYMCEEIVSFVVGSREMCVCVCVWYCGRRVRVLPRPSRQVRDCVARVYCR